MIAHSLLKDLADRALKAIVDNWPETSQPLPDRRYVTNGQVFVDCEQLTVGIERIYGTEGVVSAETWNQDAMLFGFKSVVLSVMLLRCVPEIEAVMETVTLPSGDDIDASAGVILGDAVDVWNLLQAAQDADRLATTNGLAFQDWNFIGPEGGIAGGVTRVRALML